MLDIARHDCISCRKNRRNVEQARRECTVLWYLTSLPSRLFRPSESSKSTQSGISHAKPYSSPSHSPNPYQVPDHKLISRHHCVGAVCQHQDNKPPTQQAHPSTHAHPSQKLFSRKKSRKQREPFGIATRSPTTRQPPTNLGRRGILCNIFLFLSLSFSLRNIKSAFIQGGYGYISFVVTVNAEAQ